MSCRILIAVLCLAFIPARAVWGITFTDNFDTSHDYSTGTVPAGGIWDGVYNAGSGGDVFNANSTTAGNLRLGIDQTGWGGGGVDNARFLFKRVDLDQLREVRTKITAQTAGQWSTAGILVRLPAPLDDDEQNDYMTAGTSFRSGDAGLGGFGLSATTLDIERGAETEDNTDGMADMTAVPPRGPISVATDLTYLRLVHQGVGFFQLFSSPDGTNWTLRDDAVNTRGLSQAGGIVEVGLWGGTYDNGGAPDLTGANVEFDSVEIITDPDTPEPLLSWNQTISRDWNDNNWNLNGGKPDSNISVAVFGDVLNAAMVNQRTTPTSVFTDQNVTVKELRFDTAISYAIAGTGSITLDADSGNALINVNAGTHEIQTDLLLADNVTATAATGAVLNINAPIVLNGRTFTTAGAGMVNMNHGTVSAGSAAGAGQFINDGILSGLASVEGDFTQSAAGSLAVSVGDGAIDVSGEALLAGVLDVSLADGLVPAAGTAYRILSAKSVTDLGLSLAGADARLFRLFVDANSVSLVAGAIPEPATFGLAALALLAGGMAGRRRRRGHTQSPGPSRKDVPRSQRSLFFCALVVITAPTLVSELFAQHPVPPGMLLETRRDDFGGATPHAMQHDYTTGMVPAGGIWSGIHNPTNGGGPFGDPPVDTPALFVADGTAFDGTDKAGKLHVEDLNLHPQTSGTPGIGWEGDRNNAPMLYTNVPAENDFDAVVKIDQQTSGQWTWAGIIARVAGPPVGLGDGDGLDPAENYVSAGRFATDVANAATSTILRKNIVNGAQVADGQFGAIEGGNVPLWVRLTKIGGEFSTARSSDGTTWETFPDATVNNGALVGAGQTVEVGIGYMLFNGANVGTGTADFDSFEIKIYEGGTPTDATWSYVGSENWSNAANWDVNIAGVVPDHDTINVTLGGATVGPSTIINDQNRMVKSLTFDSANKYAIGGLGMITLQADSGLPAINVMQGTHEIQVDVALASSASVMAAPGTRLDIDGQLDFVAAGRTVTVTGGGKVNFNNNINLPINGTVAVGSGGNAGGNGRINGNLTNNAGGTVSPGTSAGTLTVEGSFQQTNAASSLAIEIGGTAPGTFDRLMVSGLAALNGALNVSLINGFTPQASDTFQIVTAAGNLTGTFNNTPGGVLTTPAGTFNVTYMSGANGFVRLSNFMGSGTPGLPGDYNGNGTVDAADYVLWRDGGTLQNDSTPGVQPDDYNVWRANFGRTSGSGASISATVPEPCSVMLLALGIAVISRRATSRRIAGP
jgi:hypothetical protein